MNRDLHNNILAAVALATATINSNTTTSGLIIDTAGYESLEFIVLSGTITDGAYALNILESDDSGMSGATSVPAADVLGDLTGFALADDNVVKRIGSIGKKRYQQLQIISTAVTTGGSFGAVAVQGHPKHAPVA